MPAPITKALLVLFTPFCHHPDLADNSSAHPEDKPSLLVVILDTNPFAWSTLHDELPLQTALSHILLLLNAHLSFSYGNQVAAIASHTKTASFLYPVPPSPATAPVSSASSAADPLRDANKYRLFAQIEDTVQTSLRSLLSTTAAATIEGTSETMMSGALSLALSYIHRTTTDLSPTTGATTTASAPRAGDIGSAGPLMTARILVVSVSGDLANQYVAVMNSIFAAQRLRVPIDICKIAGDTVFLQQASDSTGGIYMQLQHPRALLQYLMVSGGHTLLHAAFGRLTNADSPASSLIRRLAVI